MMRLIFQNLFVFIGIFFSVTVSAYEYKFIRDGKIYIRGGDNEEITIVYKEVYMASSHKDYVYLQSPDGEMLQLIELGFNETNGEFTLSLNAGLGDYILSFPSQTFRKFSITIPDNLKSVYEPPKFYKNCHAGDGFDIFYFHVPEDASSFKILGRKDHNSGVDSLNLYDTGNNFIYGFELPKQTQPGAYLPYNHYEVINPEPGFWKIHIDHNSYPEKVAFWLDDIPNYFCIDTSHWFIPEFNDATSNLFASRVCGAAGKIGGSLGGNPIQKAMDNVEFMGLESNNYYITQKHREPENDNADPFFINWPAFNWDDDYRIGVYTGSPYNLEMFSLISPADWIQAPLLSQAQKDEFAEFYEAYAIHHNVDNQVGMKYFSPIDEPNHKGYEVEDYASLIETIALRKNNCVYPEVNYTSLLIPSSSNFLNACGTGKFGVDFAEYVYQNHDELVDGINFHIWDERDLLSAHCFADEVMTAHNIMATYDTDGDTCETIVLEQTNMSSGDGSSPYYVNTFYASLWWTGVVCRTMNTGYMTYAHWFTTIDDSHHKKGMMYSDTNFTLKPIGYTVRFLIENKLDSVIESNYSHPEVDALVTIDSAKTMCYIIASNKGRRFNTCNIQIDLPEDFGDHNSCEVLKTDSNNYLPVMDSSFVLSGSDIDFNYKLSPYSIYSFRINSSPVAINEDRSSWNNDIYPNPTSGILHIRGEILKKISVINIHGKIVMNKTCSNSNHEVLMLNKLSSGLYFINVTESRGQKSYKVIRK